MRTEKKVVTVPLSGDFEFVSSTQWQDGKADTLVVRCSDHRLRTHFEELLQDGLGLRPNSYDLLVVPGGPQFLFADDLVMPKYAWAGNNWLKFLVENHRLKKIIFLAHYGCGWYKFLNSGEHALDILKEKQLADLRKIPEKIKRILPHVEIKMFYAQPHEEHVRFLEIKAGY